MSFIGGFFLGGGMLSSPYTPVPAATYNQIRLNGGATIDKVRVLRRCMTTEEMDDLTVNDTYSWDTDTLLLYSEFTNDYEAGFVTSGGSWSGYRISRIASEDKLQNVIASGLDKDTKEFWDYYTADNKTYTYIVTPITFNSVLTSFQSSSVTVSYDDVYLIDSVTGEYYKFSLNVELGSISTIKDRTKYDKGYSQYPAFSQSKQKYRESTGITALMGYMDGNNYIDTSSYLNALETFILNDNNKILKGIKDDIIMLVKTYDFTFTPDLATNSTKISFSFTEVGGVQST